MYDLSESVLNLNVKEYILTFFCLSFVLWKIYVKLINIDILVWLNLVLNSWLNIVLDKVHLFILKDLFVSLEIIFQCV